jgi:hypothetical protein
MLPVWCDYILVILSEYLICIINFNAFLITITKATRLWFDVCCGLVREGESSGNINV